MDIDWKNDKEREIFAKAGLVDFADIVDIDQNASKLDLLSMRDHRDKKTGEVDRQMVRITIGSGIYYLKRAYDTSFENVKTEYEAIKILPGFGLKASEVAGCAFDESAKKGFIILKDLTGFHSIKEILLKHAPEDALTDFISRKDEILRKTAETIRNIHRNGYVYPDWFAKHIYIKKGSDEIALIDLERFRPVSECPWYYSFPVTSYFVCRKIFRKLRISLERESDLLSHKYLKSILYHKR